MVAEALFCDQVQFYDEVVLPSGALLSESVRDGVLGGTLYRFSRTVWDRFRRFGLPNGQGWQNEREIVLRCIEIWETARLAHEKYELEKIRSRR